MAETLEKKGIQGAKGYGPDTRYDEWFDLTPKEGVIIIFVVNLKDEPSKGTITPVEIIPEEVLKGVVIEKMMYPFPFDLKCGCETDEDYRQRTEKRVLEEILHNHSRNYNGEAHFFAARIKKVYIPC